MAVWLIEPHDPLIVRDGRPFGVTPGVRASSLPFPLPSTTAGAVRTLIGQDKQGLFRDGEPAVLGDVLKVVVRGPLLAEITADPSNEGKERVSYLAPAPADALMLTAPSKTPGQVLRKQLVPLALESGEETDLTGHTLALVGPRTHSPGKISPLAPRYWHWQALMKWLSTDGHEDAEVTLQELGHNGPVLETRVHVGIDPDLARAKEGLLFQTQGLEFTHAPNSLKTARRLALAVEIDAIPESLRQLHAETAFVGGERRLSQLRCCPRSLPEIPNRIERAIVRTKSCRLLLLTPAYFQAGLTPGQLSSGGVTATIVAVASSGRPQVVSGWDMAYRSPKGKWGRPKPTNRLVPAGTVLFLTLAGDAAAIKQWVSEHWLRTISDLDQQNQQNPERFQHDGFGLVVPGVWQATQDGAAPLPSVEHQNAGATLPIAGKNERAKKRKDQTKGNRRKH